MVDQYFTGNVCPSAEKSQNFRNLHCCAVFVHYVKNYPLRPDETGSYYKVIGSYFFGPGNIETLEFCAPKHVQAFTYGCTVCI